MVNVGFWGAQNKIGGVDFLFDNIGYCSKWTVSNLFVPGVFNNTLSYCLKLIA